MSILQSGRKRAWILHQSRVAAFYQAEYWSAIWEMERLIEGQTEECEFDVVDRFLQLEPQFSRKSLCSLDLNLFLGGLHFFGDGKRRFQGPVSEKNSAELLTQLRKMNWTRAELCQVARKIARAIGETNPESIRTQFCELASLPCSGYEVTMDDVECFILDGTPGLE
jgi:hypothetical protein